MNIPISAEFSPCDPAGRKPPLVHLGLGSPFEVVELSPGRLRYRFRHLGREVALECRFGVRNGSKVACWHWMSPEGAP
jgi:hypothetical protein